MNFALTTSLLTANVVLDKSDGWEACGWSLMATYNQNPK